MSDSTLIKRIEAAKQRKSPLRISGHPMVDSYNEGLDMAIAIIRTCQHEASKDTNSPVSIHSAEDVNKPQ